jgi:DNA processing protein
VLAALHAEPAGLSIPELEKVVNVSRGRIDKVLQLMSLESPAPIAKDGGKWQLTIANLNESFWQRPGVSFGSGLSLERAVLARDNREPLMDHKLVLISPYDLAAGFNVGHAMQRNKLIHALSDAALVVTSDFEKGGTWAGAIEQLEKLHFVPVFVRNGSQAGKGNSALLQLGAIPWPNPSDKSELSDALSAAAETIAAEPKQEALTFYRREAAPPLEISKVQEPSKVTDQSITNSDIGSARPKDEVSSTLLDILYRELREPLKESKVAELLGIKKPETKALLAQLVKEGFLEKLSKPIRYTVIKREDRLL